MGAIYGNPNVDYYATVTGYGTVTEWARAHGLTLDDALDAGVLADDGDDTLYVPHALMREVSPDA